MLEQLIKDLNIEYDLDSKQQIELQSFADRINPNLHEEDLKIILESAIEVFIMHY